MPNYISHLAGIHTHYYVCKCGQAWKKVVSGSGTTYELDDEQEARKRVTEIHRDMQTL